MVTLSTMVQENTDFTSKRRRTKRHIAQEQIPQHPVTNSSIGLPSAIIRSVVAGLSWIVPLYTVGSGKPTSEFTARALSPMLIIHWPK